MNTRKKIVDVALEKISFSFIQKYLANNNWIVMPSKREHLSIWHWGEPTQLEILLPLDSDFADYNDLIIKALEKISLSENRDIEKVINDFLLPPSDVIRFRVNNKKTENGLITFNEGFALLENAKKSLFSTACDIVNPTSYHQRMSYKKAQQFIDSCYLGQTERGSFIASVVCPFINTSDEKPIQLSLFQSDDDLSGSFTRTVTRKYMNSLRRIKQIVQKGELGMIEKFCENEAISGNFIESILKLGEYADNAELEILTSWSPVVKRVIDVPNTISFTKDYILPMEAIVSKLKPKDEGINDVFVGKIFKAKAEPDIKDRNGGEIIFNFIGNTNKIMNAKVFLVPEDFSKACVALDKGLNVKIKGKLLQSGKTKTIDNPVFELL